MGSLKEVTKQNGMPAIPEDKRVVERYPTFYIGKGSPSIDEFFEYGTGDKVTVLAIIKVCNKEERDLGKDGKDRSMTFEVIEANPIEGKASSKIKEAFGEE